MTRFDEQWEPLYSLLSEVEAEYRDQRLRPGGWKEPEGADLDSLMHCVANVCRLYLATDTGERRTIREFAAKSYVLPRLLSRLADSYAARIAIEGEDALLIALSAVSIENLRTDYRETLLILGSLYIAAAGARIDADACLMRAANLSSDKHEYMYNPSSMRELLLGFKQSAFFHADVAPHLR